ncbi:MAG: AAA family ATPase [Chloroflexi bacterium]|nr:AAA family ATPase [Chloroflexota bacterium]
MVDMPALIQAMLRPELYPDRPAAVELVQTQMSFLLLAGGYVYKVKKPVNLGYLDYTTLEQRRNFCEREVELNRRLCPDIYLGVVPVIERGGQVALGGAGEAVEYAVKMRRLRRERMLDVLLVDEAVTARMMTALAGKLARFHARAATGPEISRFGELDALRVNTEENFSQTYDYIGRTIAPEKYRRIKDYTDGFLESNAALFRRRAAGGRIRDCHGDLHAAHVCFSAGICIYDCIEFNDRFRYCDVASETAFLAMDLDHYGRADLSGHFARSYARQSGDDELAALLKFYKCYRAYVRGKVEGFKLHDPYISPEDKRLTLKVAGSYFDLAGAYTRSRPLLLVMMGLVGTGKTTVAQLLARRLGLEVISSDVTRKKLAGVPLREPHRDEFDTGLYAAGFTRRTYDRMFREARKTLGRGDSVVLDASFIKAGERGAASALAGETAADFFVVECVLDESSIKSRLAGRLAGHPVSDGRPEILEPQKKRYEPVTGMPESYIRVDTSGDMDEVVTEIVRRVE